MRAWGEGKTKEGGTGGPAGPWPLNQDQGRRRPQGRGPRRITPSPGGCGKAASRELRRGGGSGGVAGARHRRLWARHRPPPSLLVSSYARPTLATVRGPLRPGPSPSSGGVGGTEGFTEVGSARVLVPRLASTRPASRTRDARALTRPGGAPLHAAAQTQAHPLSARPHPQQVTR